MNSELKLIGIFLIMLIGGYFLHPVLENIHTHFYNSHEFSCTSGYTDISKGISWYLTGKEYDSNIIQRMFSPMPLLFALVIFPVLVLNTVIVNEWIELIAAIVILSPIHLPILYGMVVLLSFISYYLVPLLIIIVPPMLLGLIICAPPVALICYLIHIYYSYIDRKNSK